MTLVIPISHVDRVGALRLIRWIAFMSSQHGYSMLNEKILLVVSQRASKYPTFKPTCWIAAKAFGEARCHIPDGEYEKGWPASANWSFKEALNHVAQHLREDMFWLEADAIPVRPTWWNEIKAEWSVAQAAGKSFMGALVPHARGHMTGVAVYGRNWRSIAPSLVECPDHDAFDTYSGPQVLPNMHQTPLIQHVFRRHDPNWAPPGLGILDPRACVFHQDKVGKLIYLLDEAHYKSECRFHPLYGYATLETNDKTMRRFYYAQNATRHFRSGDKTFIFEQLQAFGGAVPGAYMTDSESLQVALNDLASNPATGISEITQEEYENCTKKKLPPESKSTSPHLSAPLQAALLSTPSKSPAVLVVDPQSTGDAKEGPVTIKDIDEVLKTEKIEKAPSQVPPSGRPRKIEKPKG